MNCKNKSRNKSPVSTPVSASTQDPKRFDKAKKNKKKKYHKDKKKSRKSRDTPTFGVNAAKVGDKKRRRKKKDPREITYYNCNKLGYYAD